jgi:predicted small lipoprotein YifL
VQTPRRPAFRSALAILAIAGLLAACGVKGDLEAPPAEPQPRLSAQPAGASIPAGKVFTEESRITNRSNQDILPTMPPKEWEKSREYQPARSKGAAPSANTRREPEPDKPFFLDSLL